MVVQAGGSELAYTGQLLWFGAKVIIVSDSATRPTMLLTTFTNLSSRDLRENVELAPGDESTFHAPQMTEGHTTYSLQTSRMDEGLCYPEVKLSVLDNVHCTQCCSLYSWLRIEDLVKP